MSKYSIGIKSKIAKDADFIKIDGKCYYRTGKQSLSNNQSVTDVGNYYLPECPTLTKYLSTIPLCAASCRLGEYVLNPNQAMPINPGNYWFQFKFNTNQIGDQAILKFIKPDYISWFTKDLKYDSTGVIFDQFGPHEHTFNPTVYPTSYTFVEDSTDYCLTYAHPGSFVFVMAVSSVNVAPTPTPVITQTPTPTPTPPEPTQAGVVLCDDTFNPSASWPSSGSNIISFWFDAAEYSTLRTPNANPQPANGDQIIEWLDRSGNGKHIKQEDSLVWSPTYVSSGKVGGGPGVKFTQDFTNGSKYLSYDSGSIRQDHRAVFIVTETSSLRGNGEQGLVTANTQDPGAVVAYGNMITLEQTRSHWVGVNIGSIVRQSIYSNTYTGGDGGQFYMNGSAVPDNWPVVGPTTSTFSKGAIFGGVRTHPSPALMDGLCVGSNLKNAQGFGAGWNGQINEIIILDDVPSDQFRQEIEAYLACKWGLIDYLPADHPCKTGECIYPTPTPTVEPTPLPPPPAVTPVWPQPTLPSGPSDGVNLVTPTQLFDTLTQRSSPTTLWLGGMYEREWTLTKNRLDAVTGNNTIIEFITSSNSYVSSKFKETTLPTKNDPWQTQFYKHTQPGLECLGGTDLTLRTAWNGDWADNVDTELLYCLGNIQSGTLNDTDKTLHELLSPEDWAWFVNAIYSTSTPEPDLYGIDVIEQTINIPLSIDTSAYMYNILDAYLPLTTLYKMDADPTNPSPLSNHRLPGLNVGHHVTRLDVAAHLMYHHHGLTFWQAPIIIDDRYSLELMVKLPGTRDTHDSYDNVIGNLQWEVSVELIDKLTNEGRHSRVETSLPATPPVYIPETASTISISDFNGYNFKITPYCGDFRGSTTVDLINNANNGILPVLFVRIDREPVV
jgi:hypothetical protein